MVLARLAMQAENAEYYMYNREGPHMQGPTCLFHISFSECTMHILGVAVQLCLSIYATENVYTNKQETGSTNQTLSVCRDC